MNVTGDEVDSGMPTMRVKQHQNKTRYAKPAGPTQFEYAMMHGKKRLAYDARAEQNNKANLAVDDLIKDEWLERLDFVFRTLLFQITDDVANSHRQLALSVKDLVASEYSPTPDNDLSIATSTLPDLGTRLKVEGNKVESDMISPQSLNVEGIEAEPTMALTQSQASVTQIERWMHPEHRHISKKASKYLQKDEGSRAVDSTAAPRTLPLNSEDFIEIKTNRELSLVFAHANEGPLRPKYHVEDLYSKQGICQAVARSQVCNNITILVICFNAVYIGIAADWNTERHLYRAHPVFIIAENMFGVYFTLEILTRMLAFRHTCDCLRDGWFRFDFALAVVMWIELWFLPPWTYFVTKTNDAGYPMENIRLTRLLRLTRMSRLARQLPEMSTLSRSLIAGLRAVLSCCLLIGIATYMFAMMLHALMADQVQTNETLERLSGRSFKSVGRCMWSLTIDGTFLLDTHLVMTELLFSNGLRGIIACTIFAAFVLVANVTLMNMLVGVLVDQVSEGAKVERDNQEIQWMKETIMKELERCDDGDGKITKQELFAVMNDAAWQDGFKALNIDKLYLTEIQAMLFPTGENAKVDIQAVMHLILSCRGGLTCTVEHMANAQASLLCMLNDMTGHLEDRIIAHCSQIESLVKTIAPERRLREFTDDGGHNSSISGVGPSDQFAGVSINNGRSDFKDKQEAVNHYNV